MHGSTGFSETAILANNERPYAVVRDFEHERQRMSLTQLIQQANKAWHGVKLGQPDWGQQSHSVAFSAELRKEGILVHIILNAYWEPLDFELPPVGSGRANPWHRVIDTALDSPHDIVPWEAVVSIPGYSYRAEARSVVVLYAGLK